MVQSIASFGPSTASGTFEVVLLRGEAFGHPTQPSAQFSIIIHWIFLFIEDIALI